MAASAFIRLLESRGLLDPEIISELDRQVETSKVRVTPEAIAKLLVENGQLTRFQATKLIAELNESVDRSGSDPTAALRGGRPLETAPSAVSDHDSVEDLLPDELVAEAAEVVAAEEVEEVTPVQVVVQPSARASRRDADEDFDSIQSPRQVIRDNPSKKNSWESFRILGIGAILALLLVALIPLVMWVMKGSAQDAYGMAESAYESRDYEKAAKLFNDFAYKFSGDENASKAKILAVLAQIREDAEKVADPTVALKSAQDLLPKVSSEDDIDSLRTDMADVLLRLSEKFVGRIEATESLDDREKLLAKMGEQIALVRDPRYIATQERTQNALRIQNIEEGMLRAQRDIQKGRDLLVAIDSMSKSNEAKDVNKSYEIRREIVRKYPILESDGKLNELLANATGLQKDLVLGATQLPTVSTELASNDVVAKAILVNKTGKGDSSLSETVYLKVKGSLVALRVSDGTVLWSQYVGRDWTGRPQQLSSSGDGDVLVSFPEQGAIRRLSAADGSIVWDSKFQCRIQEPVIDRDEIFLTTSNGEAFAIDSSTGQVRWGKKFPQTIETAPGGALGKKRKYIVGNHSNLYAVSRASGACEEVEYLGHNPGTIAIPPIWIMNHLIVFENSGPDYSFVKVFSTNEEGLEIKPSQQIPMRFRGHFVVEPQIEGRRFVVATNLGEVAVLEVDASSTKDKVTKMASIIEKESSPKVNWPLMVGSDLYLASDRLAFYQIQVSSQKINPSWQKYAKDQFTARPIKLQDSILLSRVVRGNLGVRIASINPQTGSPNWETDIGVPISAITGSAKQFTALTTQGAVYTFDAKAFDGKQPIQQVENLGGNELNMKFTNPVQLKDGRFLVMNSEKADSMLLVDPSKSRSLSKMIAVSFGEAKPSNDLVAVGNNVIVPLSNAQLAMFDPDKGQQVGIPFQPTVRAGEIPKWLNPIVLADGQSIVIADTQRSMYKLSTNRQLRTVIQQDLERPLKGRLSVLSNTVVAVSANDSGDQLDFFDGIELKRFASLPVEGRFAWGPYVATGQTDSLVVVLSDIEGLVAVDESGKRRWSTPLEREEFVDKPIVIENDVIVGTSRGDLLRFSLTDGKMIGKTTVGQPLSASPLQVGKGLLIPCDEGSIVTLPLPAAKD
jgi:outer membrane protein assembly factor BamB